MEQPIPRVIMENSPRLHTLIHDGKLELSLSDALSLMLENDLDIVIQRYVITVCGDRHPANQVRARRRADSRAH